MILQKEDALVDFSDEPDLTVYKLTITAGEMTEMDWDILSNLWVMTHFKIKDAVSPVADIPAGSRNSSVLHGNVIVSVIVPQATRAQQTLLQAPFRKRLHRVRAQPLPHAQPSVTLIPLRWMA